MTRFFVSDVESMDASGAVTSESLHEARRPVHLHLEPSVGITPAIRQLVQSASDDLVDSFTAIIEGIEAAITTVQTEVAELPPPPPPPPPVTPETQELVDHVVVEFTEAIETVTADIATILYRLDGIDIVQRALTIPPPPPIPPPPLPTTFLQRIKGRFT